MSEKNYFRELETEDLLLKEFEEIYTEETWNGIFSDYEYYRTCTTKKLKDYETYSNIVSGYKEQYEKGNYFHWAITLKENNSILGGIRLRQIDLFNHKCSMAWVLMKQEQGQ